MKEKDDLDQNFNIQSYQERIKNENENKKNKHKKIHKKVSSVNFVLIALIISIIIFCVIVFFIIKKLRILSDKKEIIKFKTADLIKSEQKRIESVKFINDKEMEINKKGKKIERDYTRSAGLNKLLEDKKSFYEKTKSLGEEIKNQNLISYKYDLIIHNLILRIKNINI